MTANDVVQPSRAERPGGRRPNRAAARAGGSKVPTHHEHAGPASTRPQFADIVLKTRVGGPNSAKIRWSGVALRGRLELGAQEYDQICRSTPSRRWGCRLPVARLERLQVRRRRIRPTKELKQAGSRRHRLPIVYDTTPFICESVAEVFKTLRDAVILVAIVVLFFLQDWRARDSADRRAGGPCGHFAVMAGMGFG